MDCFWRFLKSVDASIELRSKKDLIENFTRKREIEALRDIGDSYPKVMLTTDILQTGTTEDGIKIVNLIDWLLENN